MFKQIIIPKGGMNVTSFSWYLIEIICARALCPIQHTLIPPHENIMLHTPLCAKQVAMDR
jgi:hypothetical protein